MSNQTVPAPPQFASKFGYSQARRVGNFIAVSATPGRDAAGAVVGEGDAYMQARQALENVRRSVEALGGQLQQVVRTRIYLIDMAHLWAIGRAHLEFFAGIDPATSLIKVTGFFDPKILVEIDCDAVVADPHGTGATHA